MRKILITIITILCFGLGNADAQLTVSMSSSQVAPNTQASVDVTVSGFTNLLGVQFSINFDSLVLAYGNATNFSGTLPGLSASAVSGPNGVGVKNGQITFSWFDQQGTGKSVPDGTRLFTIVFNAIGPVGSKSDIVTSSVPRVIEIVNADFMNVNLINNKGTVTIKGDGPVDPCPNPTCSDPNSLILAGTVINSEKNKTVCIPISVKNFRMMQSGQGSIKWDPTLLQYTEVKTPASGGIPGFSGGFNANNAANGEFKYLWANDNPAVPLTLADNTVIMELCFKVLGNTGQIGCILIGQGTLATEWENATGTVPVCFNYGKVTVVDLPPPNAVLIKAGTATGTLGSEVCIDVTVDNFTNILGASTTLTWDPTELEFVRTDMYMLEGLNSTAFNNTSSSLKFLWISPAAVTKANGSKIFQICFKIKKCLTGMAVNIPGPTEIVGAGSAGSVVVPSQTMAGSISCTIEEQCSATCTLGAVTATSCSGTSDGAVSLTVTGTNLGNHTIEWKNAAGTVVKPSASVTAGTNLTGVPAGTYTYEVKFGTMVCCTGSASVISPTQIVIPQSGVVINVGCGQKGSINITSTTGGNGGFIYKWTPELGNTANPLNLDAGSYTVLVTDSKGCTATATFTVGNTSTELSVTTSSAVVKCKGGSDGSIQINASGGCAPYSYSWSTSGLSGNNPQNLKAGVYTVTVSDSSTPAQTKTATVTITEPSAAVEIALTGITDASSATSSDGVITLTITGGTPNYKTVWSGPTTIADGNTSGVIDAKNLKTGSYSVTVTDANGCTAVRSAIEVPIKDPVVVAPEVGSSSVSSSFNGFGVPCFGDDDGAIVCTVSGGTYPMTATLKSGSQTIRSITINGPDVSFTGLVAGSYTIEVSNSKGTKIVGPLVVTQPTKLAVTPSVSCTEANKETGSIELKTNNTGAGNYGYTWFGLTDLDNKAENLAKGFYNVTVTDANGCEDKLSNIEIDDCEITGVCYKATTVITPNGDNFNDLFLINCVNNTASDLTVFDRWGRVVYSQNNYDNTWQGVDKDGKDLKEGGYIWVLTVNFGQGRREVHKGTVTLLRAN